MSKWTHILSLWLGSEISSALQNRSQRKQLQHDDDAEIEALEMELEMAYEDSIEQATWADEAAESYEAQIAELNDEIARLRLYVADLECELDDLRDEYDC